MAKGEEITTRFRVDISDLKSGIAEANQQIKLANAEFKAATAGMDDWSKSADGIKAKLSQLDSVLSAQKSKLEAYTEQLSRQEKAYDENGRRAAELRSKLEELANNGVAKTSKEYQQYENALAACEKEQESNKKSIDSLRITVLDQQAAVNKTEAEIGRYNSTLDDMEDATGEADKASDELAESIEEASDSAKDASGGFSVLKGALADLVADGIRKAIQGFKDLVQNGIDYESAFAGVKKTVDATDEQFARLDSDIRNMAKQMPQSASDIASVAEAAGQLGIKTDDIADFTKTMIMLGDSTNLSSEEAAVSLARFASVTGMSADEYSKLGSVIVDLGNNFATTEADIVELGMRLSAAGTQVGISQADIMAFAASLSSVGINAEAGGTAFSKLMINMQVAAENGAKAQEVIESTGMTLRDLQMLADADSKSFKAMSQDLGYTSGEMKKFMSAAQNLENFSAVTGMTAEQFRKAYAEDAVGAIQAFVAGLGDAEGGEESAIQMLTDMGITEVRLRDSILRAVNAKDLFNEAIETGRAAWEEDTALTDEANKRYETTASKIQIMKNNITDLGLQLFEEFQPAIQDTIDTITRLIEKSDEFEPAFRAAGDVINLVIDALLWLIDHGEAVVGVLTSMGAGIAAYVAYTTAIKVMKEGWMALEIVQKGVAAAQTVLNTVMAANPIGLVIAAITALVTAFIYLWNNCEEFREFWINLWDNIKEVAEKAWKAIKEFFTKAWDGIKNAFSKTKEFFKEKFEGARDAVKNAWSNAGKWFSEKKDQIQNAFSKVDSWMGDKFGGAWEAVKLKWKASVDWFKNIWESIKAIFAVVKDVLSGDFQGAWDKIKEIVGKWKDYFKGIWDGIKSIFKPVGDFFEETFNKAKDAVKGPINFIIRGLNKLISGVNKISFDVPDWVPVIGGQTWGFNIPEIPELARGGILRRGQTGFLEGNGAEAVIPLEHNKFWIHSVASDLLRQIQLSSGSSVTNIGGAKDYNFTQIINAPEAPSRIEIYRQTRNLLSYAKAAAGGA